MSKSTFRPYDARMRFVFMTRPVPLLLALAIGAVIAIIVATNQDGREDPEITPNPAPDKLATKDTPSGFRRRNTPTSLSEHKYMSELERVLEREDLSRAFYFRQKICEGIEELLESKKLTANLLATIRKYAIGTGDARRRDVLLPMLLVMKHPEATALISTAYAEATTEDERLMLMGAMILKHHNAKVASGWVVDRAISGKTQDERVRAFRILNDHCEDTEICFEAASSIYGATTRGGQAMDMAAAISRFADDSESAQAWVREKLRNPKAGELRALMAGIHSWGTEQDAKDLESLAVLFPAMAPTITERAEAIREYLLALEGKVDPNVEERRRLRIEAETKESGGKAEPDDGGGKSDRDE